MLLLAAFLAIACPATTMQNVTKYAWNSHDFKTLAYAKQRCEEIYPDAPCVKLFRKYGKQDYTVMCGR